MFKPRLLFFAASVTFIFSCKEDKNKRPYAIKDFRKSIQPYLTKVVSEGIVTYDDSTLRVMATDSELVQLSKSEHPVLRASAFREMLHRKSFDHFDILMRNLDDTSKVWTDEGEFGIFHKRISDDLLEHGLWKNEAAKSKTVENVITKHNHLRCAYVILHQLEPQEKYYTFIKDMATRPRRLDPNGYELDFDDIEYALYGLARFQKKEDVKIIKRLLMKDIRQLSNISFQLMKEYPDTAYVDIFQAYHRYKFYGFNGNRRNGFTGLAVDNADPEDFIEALAAQQNAQSAQLLDTVLKLLPMQTCMPDKENIRDEVILEIWNHPCPAYARLRQSIKSKAKEILKMRLSLSVPTNQAIDTAEEKIGWYR